MTLLHVDSSILGPYSVSRQLSAEIVARLRRNAPDLEIKYRDLAAEPVPPLSGAYLAAQQPGAPAPGAEVQQDLALGGELLDEFLRVEANAYRKVLADVPAHALHDFADQAQATFHRRAAILIGARIRARKER